MVAVRRAILLLRPAPNIQMETVTINDKIIFVVTVEQSPLAPVLTQGVAYIRKIDRTVPANAHHLLAMVGLDESRADLLQRLENFGSAIEVQTEMIRQLQADSGWRHKLLWALIGGVIWCDLLNSIDLLIFF